MRDRSHQPVLEGVRGLLVIAVVGYHSLRLLLAQDGDNWGDVDPAWWWAGTARFAVDGFFVLAGFLMVGSWRSCAARGRTRAAALRDFWARRAWRILPPYLLMLVVVVPLVAPELLRPEGWGDLARLATLQHYLDVGLPAQVNLPIWSLTTEVHFYVVVPLVAWLVWRVGGWPTYLASAGLAVWWITTTWRGELPASLLPGRLDQFVIGAAAAGLLAKAAAGRRSRLLAALTHRAALPVLVTAMLALGLYHGATFQRADDGLLAQIVHPMATVVLGGLLVRLAAGPTVPLLVRPWLVTLGSFSFSLYLWHYPVLRRGQQLLGADHGVTVQSTAAMLLLVALSVGLAVLTHHLVELPAERARARRVRRVRVRSAVVQAELRLQDLQEVAGPEGDEAGRPARRGAHDGVVLTELAQVAPVDAERRRPVALDRQS
jgi:peptidoglycan/LPS O-acetylase OafA/YrhL